MLPNRAVGVARVAWIVPAALVLVAHLVLGSVSSAAAAGGASTTTTWDGPCVINPVPEVSFPGGPLTFDTEALAQVAAGELVEVVVAPGDQEFPNGPAHLTDPGPWGPWSDVVLRYQVPAAAEVESAAIVAGSGFGTAGEPTVSIEPGDGATSVILQVPEVPMSEEGAGGITQFRLPAVALTLRAVGPVGSEIGPRLPSGSSVPGALRYVRTWIEGPFPDPDGTGITCYPHAVPDPAPGQPLLASIRVVADPAPTFNDVGEETPFHDEISWLATTGVTSGYPDGSFRPEGTVTRQATSAFLHRLIVGANDEVACDATPFPDVPADHPFCPDITWLVGEELATGYEDGSFGPDRLVTRQAMAALLQRAAGEGSGAPCVSPPFSDVPVDHPFCPEIRWLAESGVAEGYPDGSFRPAGPVSRAAMAAFLARWSA